MPCRQPSRRTALWIAHYMHATTQWGLEGIARLGREGELSPSEGLDVLEGIARLGLDSLGDGAAGITRCGREGEGFDWPGRT